MVDLVCEGVFRGFSIISGGSQFQAIALHV